MRLSHACLATFFLVSMNAAAQDAYTGFWKGNCDQAFGLQIMPAAGGEYSVSFCGPGGCFEPGTYRPNTKLADDPLYQVVSASHIKVLGRDGWSDYYKCTAETHPTLRYKDCPEDASSKLQSAEKPAKKCSG